MGRPDRDPTFPAADDRFRHLADALPQIVWIAGPDGGVEYFNGRWAEFTGMPVADSLGEAYQTALHPDDLPNALAKWHAARASGRDYENEHRFRRHDGVYRWHLARGVPVRDGGRVVQWFGTCTDIDDQRRAVETLAASERRQRFLADLAAATQPLTDPRDVMATTARLLGEHLQVDRCAYAEIDGAGADAVFDIFGDYTRGVPSIVGRWPVAAFGPEVVRLMFANEPYVMPDVDADPRAGDDLTAYRQTTIRAVVCVPLHKAGRFTAAMAVHQNVPRAWTPGEVELILLVVDRCWESIERVRASRALHGSETRFRKLVEQSPQSIQLVAPDGRTREVNRAWADLWGVNPADHLADYNLRTDPQIEALGLKDAIERAFAGEAVDLPPTGYVPVRGRFAGRQRWVRTVLYPVKDADGRVEELVLLHEDVTDRRRVEDAQRFLAEAGEVLASSMDAESTLTAVAKLVTPRLADWCGVYVVEPAGGLRQVAVAHVDPAKVAWAKEVARRFPPHPDDPRGVPAVVRTGEPEFVPEISDEMLAASVRDPAHLALVRGLGLRSVMIVPLTARGRTLGAITFVAAESGRRYEAADLQLAVDLGRRAGLAVDNARLYGEAQEALRLLGLLIDAAGRLTGTLDPAAVQATVLEMSHQLIAADAHAIWRHDPAADDWSLTGSAGLSADYLRAYGRLPGGVPIPTTPLVAEDVFASAAFERRWPAYRAEGIIGMLAVPLRIHAAVSGTLVFYFRTRRPIDVVMVRVATTLADLAGAALGTAEVYGRESTLRRAAEEADRRKDEFLAMLAHELRNPLAPIRTGVQVLGMKASDPATRTKTLEMMDRQIHHLVRLVDDLLDVSRITRGKVELRTEAVDLGEVAARAVEAARPAADARRQVLTVTPAGRPVRVQADPVRLAQVIGNLLNNAIKYTPEGGDISLSVECGKRTGERNPVRGPMLSLAASDPLRGSARPAALVRVRDSGAGIPADMLPKVFDLFTQVDRTLDRSQGGLGIGLTLVRTLTEMHGGTVEAFSAGPGRGSEFVVRLPELAAADGG